MLNEFTRPFGVAYGGITGGYDAPATPKPKSLGDFSYPQDVNRNGKRLELTNQSDDLEKFSEEMQRVLDKHQDKKGDSWKTCDMDFLRKKLEQ
jgi:hypothetical protein